MTSAWPPPIGRRPVSTYNWPSGRLLLRHLRLYGFARSDRDLARLGDLVNQVHMEHAIVELGAGYLHVVGEAEAPLKRRCRGAGSRCRSSSPRPYAPQGEALLEPFTPQVWASLPQSPRQPRSLLSIASLNIAKSRVRPSICNRVRIDQTCFGRNGGFWPMSLPLLQGSRRGVADVVCACVSMAILLGW
jgi:hypothetical protein